MKKLILLFSLVLSMASYAVEYNDSEKSVTIDYKDIRANKVSLYRGNLATAINSFDEEMVKDNVDLETARLIGDFNYWAVGIALTSDEIYFMSCNKVSAESLEECVEYKNKIIRNLRNKKPVKLYLSSGEVSYIEL